MSAACPAVHGVAMRVSTMETWQRHAHPTFHHHQMLSPTTQPYTPCCRLCINMRRVPYLACNQNCTSWKACVATVLPPSLSPKDDAMHPIPLSLLPAQ